MSVHIQQFAAFCARVSTTETVVFVKATSDESRELRLAFRAAGFAYKSIKHWVKDGNEVDGIDFKISDINFLPKKCKHSGFLILFRFG